MGEMAAKFPYMTSRKGSKNLYYKREVPPELRATGRPTQIWRSLGSPDPVEAKTPYKKLDEAVDALFLSWRSGREAAAGKNVQPVAARLSNAQIQRLCDAYYQRLIDDDFAWRSELWGKVKADPEGFINDKYIEHPRSEWYDAFYEQMTLAELFLCCVNEQHKRRLGEHQRAHAVGDCAIHGGVADAIIREHHLDVAPADRMRLIRKLIETEIAALEAILNKDLTRYDAITEKYDLSVPAQRVIEALDAEDGGSWPSPEHARSRFPRRRQASRLSQENDDERRGRPQGVRRHRR